MYVLTENVFSHHVVSLLDDWQPLKYIVNILFLLFLNEFKHSNLFHSIIGKAKA